MIDRNLKRILRKNLTAWMNQLELNRDEGEGVLIYPTPDSFQIVVHCADYSFREDKEKTMKERMGK